MQLLTFPLGSSVWNFERGERKYKIENHCCEQSVLVSGVSGGFRWIGNAHTFPTFFYAKTQKVFPDKVPRYTPIFLLIYSFLYLSLYLLVSTHSLYYCRLKTVDTVVHYDSWQPSRSATQSTGPSPDLSVWKRIYVAPSPYCLFPLVRCTMLWLYDVPPMCCLPTADSVCTLSLLVLQCRTCVLQTQTLRSLLKICRLVF